MTMVGGSTAVWSGDDCWPLRSETTKLVEIRYACGQNLVPSNLDDFRVLTCRGAQVRPKHVYEFFLTKGVVFLAQPA